MAKHQIHWAVPTTCLAGLILGLLFAVGHHIFYWSLDGDPASEGHFDVLRSKLPHQQINIAGGTAFAFLVNFCLGLAMTTAFFQLFWKEMLGRKTTLETLDATSSVISDVSQFTKLNIWANHPLLLILAIIAWLIPIASIITPGTLSVGIAPVLPAPTSLEHVPYPGFPSLNYVNDMPHLASSSEDSTQNNAYQYDGPSRTVQRLANEAAAIGQILPISVPWLNASWSMAFSGPGLECNNVPDTVRLTAEQKIMALSTTSPDGSCKPYGYLSWAGDNVILPFNASLSFGNSSGIRAINIAAMPHMSRLLLSKRSMHSCLIFHSVR